MTTPGPNRAVRRPATRNENRGTISGPGAMASPVASADQCQTSCAHSTRESSIAPNAVEKNSDTAEAPVNGRRRNSARSISGLRWRIAWATNSPSEAAPPAIVPSVLGSPQPQLPPLTSPSTRAATPPVTRSAPSASGTGTGWPGTRGSRRQPTASAARPIGTLTRKTQRQLAATSNPPTTGPAAAARPPTAVQARTAPWRRSGDEVARISPREVGVSRAAPAACTTRKATSIGTLVAAPQAAEAATNTATPSRNPCSRRYRSAARPNSTRNDAYTIAYAFRTHD